MCGTLDYSGSTIKGGIRISNVMRNVHLWQPITEYEQIVLRDFTGLPVTGRKHRTTGYFVLTRSNGVYRWREMQPEYIDGCQNTARSPRHQ